MGCTFWLVRFRLVAICLGDVSDIYPRSNHAFQTSPFLRRVLRKTVFRVLLGALFGILTLIMFTTCMFFKAIATEVYRRAASVSFGPEFVQMVQATVLEYVNGFLRADPLLNAGILLFFGGIPGILIWTLLLLCLRPKENLSDPFNTPPVPETDPAAGPSGRLGGGRTEERRVGK